MLTCKMFSKLHVNITTACVRSSKRFSTSGVLNELKSCKLLVVGGGTGGCSTSAKFARLFNNNKMVIIVEPSEYHYYQPMFTFVGGGLKKIEDCRRSTCKVLPLKSTWLKDEVVEFSPKQNEVKTRNGEIIKYEYMLVACGIHPDLNSIPGLLKGLEQSGGVCCNFSPQYAAKTFKTIEEFESGNAIFTYPNSPVKCPGAAQKICYLAEHYFRKVSVNLFYTRGTERIGLCHFPKGSFLTPNEYKLQSNPTIFRSLVLHALNSLHVNKNVLACFSRKNK